jgi:hypothetical protein
MKALMFLKALVIAPFLYLAGGTLLGKAPYFKHAKRKKVGAWWLIELSAADREKLRELAAKIADIDDTTSRGQTWIYMKMQVIASCAVNRRGWYLYDPMDIKHLNKLADYPGRLIEDALQAIHELNDMPWLLPPSTAQDEEGEAVNP